MLFLNRKIYLIKKDFQLRFILRFVLTATVWTTAAVVLFVITAERRLEDVLYSTHITVRTTSELLLGPTITAQVLTLLLFAVVLSYSVYRLWIRLSVPLMSIKKDILRISGGDLVMPVSVGEGEEFQDLAAQLDGMRGRLREKIEKIKKGHAELSGAAMELQRSILKGSPSASQAKQLRESLGRLKEDVNAFTS